MYMDRYIRINTKYDFCNREDNEPGSFKYPYIEDFPKYFKLVDEDFTVDYFYENMFDKYEDSEGDYLDNNCVNVLLSDNENDPYVELFVNVTYKGIWRGFLLRLVAIFGDFQIYKATEVII